MKRTRPLGRFAFPALLILGLLSAPALTGAARNPDKVNTASANPVLTTQQVIVPAVLGQHRTGTLLLLHVNDIHDFAYGVGEYRRNLKLAGLPTVCAWIY